MKSSIHTLGEIAEITMGQSPPSDTYNTQKIGLPFFQGKAEFGDEHPTPVKWCSAPVRIAEAGDILLTVRAPVGPTNIASEKCCIGRGLASIRAKPEFALTRYLRFFFKYFEEEIASKGVGSTFTAINRNDISRLKIKLPSLSEQERIVRLLDEAESLRATRERTNEHMDQFVPALFQELFDTASNEIISNSNNDWKEMKLGDVCSFTRGPFGGSLKKNEFKSDGYAVYEQRHAIHKDYSEIRYFINEEKFKEMARFELHPGELIMSCSGVTLGRVSIAPENMKPGIINQALLKLTPLNKKISVEFLKIWMESESFQVSIRKHSQGAAIPNVASVKILKDIPIYLPPLPLQREFAARVEEARGVQSAQARSTEKIEALYQSMLSRAFKGEL